MQVIQSPGEFLDVDGNPVSISSLKVGDKIYKKIGGKLVAATVLTLNPLTVATR